MIKDLDNQTAFFKRLKIEISSDIFMKYKMNPFGVLMTEKLKFTLD